MKVTNYASFTHIKVRFSELSNYCDSDVPKILVGNKNDDNNDMNKVVLTNVGHEYAEQNNLPFFETSVKDNKNIKEVFNEMAKLVLKRRLEQLERVESSTSGTRIEQKQTIVSERQKRCCST